MERNRPVKEPEETPPREDRKLFARGGNGRNEREKKVRDPEQAPRGRTIPHLF